MSKSAITPTAPWDPYASPLIPCLDQIIGSIANIAPERRDELTSLVERAKFIVDDEPGFGFRSRGDSDPREVLSSIVGLELLWCLAYAHITIYQEAPQLGEGPNGASPLIQFASGVLVFAFTDRAQPRTPKFALPDDIPRPAFWDMVQKGSFTNLHMATDVFACATAWILHHELAHVDLGHLDTTMAVQQDELDADHAATEWILASAPSNTVTKRGLGIALALAALVALALGRPYGHARRSNYPPTAERILRVMSHPAFGVEHQVHDFAAVAINTHLQQRRIPTPVVENAYDALHAACALVKSWELGL